MANAFLLLRYSNRDLEAGPRMFTLRAVLVFSLAAMCLLISTPADAKKRTRFLVYEEPAKPQHANANDRAIRETVDSWSQARSHTLGYDPRLGRVSRRLLKSQGVKARANMNTVRRIANQHGVTDGKLAFITAHAPSIETLSQHIKSELTAALQTRELTHFGLSVRESSSGYDTLIVFSERMLELKPIRARVPKGRKLSLKGKLMADPSEPQPLFITLSLTRPDGEVEQRKLPVEQGQFRTWFPAGQKPGVIQVQLSVERGHGPEIAALFPIGVKLSPWKRAPEVVIPEAPLELEPALSSLLIQARRDRGLNLPAQSSLLAEIARSHAHDMLDNRFFGHVSAKTGDLTDRLANHRIRYVKAFENIAAGSSVENLLEQWLDSPSHRANLFAPSLTAFGVGVVGAPELPAAPLYAVLVLITQEDTAQATTLTELAYSRANEARSSLGLDGFKRDPKLDAIALRHSREIASAGKVTDHNPLRGNLADTVFDETGVWETAVDIYRTTTVDVVMHASNLRDGNFDKLGVGIYRRSDRLGEPLWITVVYATQ